MVITLMTRDFGFEMRELEGGRWDCDEPLWTPQPFGGVTNGTLCTLQTTTPRIIRMMIKNDFYIYMYVLMRFAPPP